MNILTPNNPHTAAKAFIGLLREYGTEKAWYFGTRINDDTELISFSVGDLSYQALSVEINDTGIFFGYRGLGFFKVEEEEAISFLKIVRNNFFAKHPYGMQGAQKDYKKIRAHVAEAYGNSVSWTL